MLHAVYLYLLTEQRFAYRLGLIRDLLCSLLLLSPAVSTAITEWHIIPFHGRTDEADRYEHERDRDTGLMIGQDCIAIMAAVQGVWDLLIRIDSFLFLFLFPGGGDKMEGADVYIYER